MRSAAAIVVLASALGCGPGGAGRMDSWYTPGHPSGVALSESLGTSWKTIHESLVLEVSGEKRGEAEQLLANDVLLRLTPEHAGKLAGATLPDASRKQVCLVRGVHLDRKSGVFRVYFKGDELLVHHESKSGMGTRMGRQPLIVLLEKLPAKVWVGCTGR